MSDQSDSTPLVSSVIMWLITALSYLLLLLTLPISYWWCVVTLAEHDRMVIFRLGKMQGARGPGKVGSINVNIIIVDVGLQVVTFPWLDQCKKVDVRASAFSVPPQQFITQVQSGEYSASSDENWQLESRYIFLHVCTKLDIWSMHCR